MVKELHGKHYYIELKKGESLLSLRTLLDNQRVLHDEVFDVMWHNGNQVLYSKAKCTTFRGEKYRAWEKVKRDFYAVRKQKGLN